MLTLSIRTGDVSSTSLNIRCFVLAIDRPPTVATLYFSKDHPGQIQFDDWLLFLEQIQAGELVNRRFHGVSVAPPLGQPSVFAVAKEINSTSSYQLFLAGIEIAERIEFVSDSSPNNVKRRFNGIKGWMPSLSGSGGLFFVPDQLVKGKEKSIEQLLKNNKLCEATLSVDVEERTRYYVPYATPIGFIASRVDDETDFLWDDIRSLYDSERQVV